MGMQVGGSKSGALAEMNVVPLIDILLVLIIIFMVITPLNSRGLEALVPQPTPPNQKQDPALENLTVVVTVTANGKLKINQDDITWEGLGPLIEHIFKERAQKVTFIKAHDSLLFPELTPSIDIIRSSGVDSV